MVDWQSPSLSLLSQFKVNFYISVPLPNDLDFDIVKVITLSNQKVLVGLHLNFYLYESLFVSIIF